MWFAVHSLIEEKSRVTVGGFSTPVVIESSEHATRALLDYSDGSSVVISGDQMVAARGLGIHYLIIAHQSGYMAVSVERFLDSATAMVGGWLLASSSPAWKHFKAMPDVEDIVLAHQAPEISGGGFVHLHSHSDHSALDGLSTVSEMLDLAEKDNQPALALTDHGVCSGHAELSTLAVKRGIKPIFGVEAYFVDDRRWRPMSKPKRDVVGDDYDRLVAQWEEEQKRGRGYWHLVLLAQNDVGLRNVWALTNHAHDEGFYYKPRVDWDLLEQYGDGIIATTACLRGPISTAIMAENEDLVKTRMSRLLNVFGDRLYIELHTNQLEDQLRVNTEMARLSQEWSIEPVVVCDSHYPTAAHAECHKVWIAMQTNKDIQDDPSLFGGDQDYHLQTRGEVAKAISALGDIGERAIANTVAVADRCDAVLAPRKGVPIISKKATEAESLKRDAERLWEMVTEGWARHVQPKIDADPSLAEQYLTRLEKEYDLLVEKGFCGYFMMVAGYCSWAKANGILVGPGRGSGGASLVAWLVGITGIDPVEADLLFERFLTRGRKSLPDFDVDFPASKRDELTQHVVDTWGESHVVRIGTHTRKQPKNTFRSLERVLRSNYFDQAQLKRDINEICNIIDRANADSAGLGHPWEEIREVWADALAPYVERYPEIFDYADKLVGRISTFGRHPAGLIVDPVEPVAETIPTWKSSEGQLISMWDGESVEELGLVKFDLLTLRTLDTLQMCVDLIERYRDVKVDFYGGIESDAVIDTVSFDQPEVWDEICAGHTKGMFQLETHAVTAVVLEVLPRNLKELADVITLVRPGPTDSGLRDLYNRRRHGHEPVTYLHPSLEPILSRTYGAMIYQEQVMQTTMILAGYDEDEADAVRKILGKKKLDQVAAAGEKFIAGCDEVGRIDHETAVGLWDQIAEYARYSFNLSHAYGYGIVAYWCAWLKVNYPIEFLTAVLSTVDQDRIPEFVAEARRMGFKVLGPDVNSSGVGFTPVDEHTIRYGLESVKGLGAKSVEAIMAHRPFESYESLVTGGAVNKGVIKTLAHSGALDSIIDNRRALEAQIEYEESGELERCRWKDESVLGPNGLPCTFDWSSVPVELTKTGKPKKNQPGPPKRCTKACRQYDPGPEETFDDVEDYSVIERMRKEHETLGVYLTSTPLDLLTEAGLEDLKYCPDYAQLSTAPLDTYPVAGYVSKVRKHTDRTGGRMAWVQIDIPGGTIETVCFASKWEKIGKPIKEGTIGFFVVHKSEDGYRLVGAEIHKSIL